MYYLRNNGLSGLEDLGQWEMAVPIAGSLITGITSLFMGDKKKKEVEKQQKVAAKLAKEQALAQGRQQAEAQGLFVQQEQIKQIQTRNQMISVGLIVFGTFALGLGSIFLVKALTEKKEK
jgi:hypothetical protein